MQTPFVVVTITAAAINLAAAGCDFLRLEKVAVNMARAGVPRSWMIPPGLLKAAGALGLLIGIIVPPIGVAAASGLILFFSGAIVTHLRGRIGGFALPSALLALAVAALALRVATA